MTVLQLPKLFHNDFASNKKPIGEVDVDRNNSITKKLHSTYMWDSFSPRELSGSVPASAISVVGSAVKLQVGTGGKGLYWDRTDNNQIEIADNGTPFEFHTSNTYSILHCFVFDRDAPSDANEYDISVTKASTGNPNTQLNITASPSIEDGKLHTLLVTYNDSGNMIAYQDGKQIGSTSANAGSNDMHQFRYQSNTNTFELACAAGASTVFMVAGTPQKASDRFQGQIIGTSLWHRDLTPAEARSITKNPFQIYKPKTPPFYFVPEVGDGLVVQDIAVATSLTSPSLTQHNALAVNDLAVSVSLTEPALSQNNNLLVDDLAASSALTSPAFVQHNALSVDPLAVASSLTEPVFVQQNILVVDDLSSLSALSSPVFVQHNALSVDDLASASSLSNVTLGIAGALSVASLSVATQLTSPVFDQHNILVVDSLAVASSLSNVSLVGVVSLAVNDLAVGTSISQVTLDATISLLVNDLAVGTSLTSPALDQHNVLLVDDMSVDTLLSIVSLGGAVISCLSGYITIQPLLGGDTTIKPTLSGNVKID